MTPQPNEPTAEAIAFDNFEADCNRGLVPTLCDMVQVGAYVRTLRAEVKAEDAAYKSVRLERERQNKKWGVQNHDNSIWVLILAEECGEFSQAVLHDKFGGSHAGTAREEAVHCAAVAIQIIQCIDRNASTSAQAGKGNT